MKLKNVGQHTNAIAGKRDGGLVAALLNPITDSLGCRAFNTSGLTYGSSAPVKLKVANEVLCSVDGVNALIAAATEVAFTAVTHDVAAGYKNMFALSADSAGACHIDMGVASLYVTGIVPPQIPAGRAVMGICTIDTTNTGFTANTTELSAATLTDKYYDVVGPWATK